MSPFDRSLMTGKVVLVSGVGPGLGKSVAAAVLRSGGSVVLGDLDGVQLAELATDLHPDGDRCASTTADITTPQACARLVDLAAARFGRLDGVVHVAAYSTASGGLMDGDLDEWDRTAAVNVKGTLRLTKAAVPLMRRSGGGSVVMIGSTAAIHSLEELPQLVYGVSKAALGAATHHLARELGPDGIRVNTIAPGWKWGARMEKSFGERAARLGTSLDDLMAPVRASHPLRRYTDDQEVANAVLFLCSDLAPSITGQVLYIDGGLTA